MEHRNISLFRGYSDTESVETSLEEIVNIIKCDAALRDRTEKHRYYLQQDLRRDADREKSGCPCFAVAVCFEGGKTREHICAWTGYTLVDLDHIAPERMAATLTLICADKYTLMAYTTISGHGIRIICRIDDLNGAEKGKAFRQYAKYFNQVNDYYSCLVGFESDGQCKNATRISGLASDPHVYYNPSAASFVLQDSPIAPQPQDGASEAVPTKRNKRLEKVVKAAERLLEEEGVSYCEHHHNEYVMRMGYLLNQYGVARKTAAAWAAEHFPDYDGDVAAVIGSCYANTGEHGTRSLVRRGEDDEKFATVADIEQFLSEQAKFRKNTVSGKFEVLMADCGEEYAELTDRYVNTLWSRMNKAGMLARIADIRSVLDSEYTPLFNPFVAYLEGLPTWDGTTDPIARLAAGVHVKDDQKLFGIYFKKWLVATIASLLDTKVVNHEILVFIGKQGIYKTTWMQRLLPVELQRYFYVKKSAPYETFVYPFHAIPAADENEAADILVQQEGYPHAADTPAEGEAEKVSHTYSYTPLHHQPYVEGVVDISCRTKGVGGEDVDGAAYFEEYIYDKDGGTHTYDVGVGREPAKDGMPRKGEDAGQHDGNHDGFLHDVFSHKEGCVRFLLAYQMPDTDGAALCHGDAEQISEHDDVDTIGTGGERFHSQHVDEVGDDDLRRAVRQLFAGGGQAYLHQVL